MADKQIKDILERVRAKYKDMAKTSINTAITTYKELIPAAETYINEFGEYKELFTLTGTIPVHYKQNIYNIPIQAYFPDDFPYKPPICYVRPTPNMSINVNDNVDSNGKIFVDYLVGWDKKKELKTLLDVICMKFGVTTPLYAKNNRPPSGNTSSQYPSNQPPRPMVSNQPSYPSSTPSATNLNQGYPSSNKPTPYPPAYPSSSSIPPYPTSSYPAAQQNSPAYQTSAQQNSTPYPPSNSGYGGYGGYGGYAMPTPSLYNQPKPPVPPPPSQSQYPLTNPAHVNAGYQTRNNYSDETLKPEYIRMSLISGIRDKARIKYQDKKGDLDAEIGSLQRTKSDLEIGEKQINEIIFNAEMEIENIKKYTDEIKKKTSQINESLNIIKHREKADIEDAVVAPTPLYRQIMQLFAEELALQDLIYFLNEGLSHKSVALDSYLKQTRVLSRRLFMVRALILKCRETAGLRA